MSKVVIIGNKDRDLYNFRQETIIALVKEHQVLAISPKGDYGEQLLSLGCEVHNIDLSRHGKNPVEEVKLFFSYLKFLRKEKPDMVFTFSIKPNLYGSLACRILKIPCAPNITGLGVAMNNGGKVKDLLLKMYKVCLKKSHTVFFQNSANLEYFKSKGFVKENYVLLPGSGVNLERYPYEEYPEDDGKTDFLFVGRIMKDKGVEEFVQAARQIKDRYPKTTFRMVGLIEPDYEEEFNKLEPERYVELFGLTDDVHGFMTKADAVVVPSYHEGMSNVSLEAAATGRPVISSRIPGCMEIVDDGVTGYSFEVKNVNAIVDALERFVSLPYQQRRDMGIKGRKKIEEQFNRTLVVEEYVKLLKN